MRAMVLNKIGDIGPGDTPLSLEEIPIPVPGDNELLIRISACGVCHTELDEIEGRTPPPRLPVVPGHQVVGIVEARGSKVKDFRHGDRVGVAWIFSACGQCHFCQRGNENLCEQFEATGRDVNGGYAEYLVVRADFVFRIPGDFSDVQAAPLLCAGAIGYRSLALTELVNGDSIGLTGFGASAHLVLQMVRYKYPDSAVYVFARKVEEQAFALELGAEWAGGIEEPAPTKLNAIVDTTPAWWPVVSALANLQPAGRLVINAIRKERRDQERLLDLDYSSHLWLEKEIKSVANITREDVEKFLELATQIPIFPETEEFSLADANKALLAIKFSPVKGAKVLVV